MHRRDMIGFFGKPAFFLRRAGKAIPVEKINAMAAELRMQDSRERVAAIVRRLGAPGGASAFSR